MILKKFMIFFCFFPEGKKLKIGFHIKFCYNLIIILFLKKYGLKKYGLKKYGIKKYGIKKRRTIIATRK